MYVNRRTILGFGLAAASITFIRPVVASGDVVMARVRQTENRIAERLASGLAIPAEWTSQALADGLDERQRRQAAFYLVQRVPYKLTAWTGDPDSLFTLQRGDCRHKSAALRRLYRAWGLQTVAVRVPFDWADLPIPGSVLSPLDETRGIHDAIEVRIDGRAVLVDATWDAALGSIGFPMTGNWDGISPTLAVTQNADIIVRPNDVPDGTNLYDRFGIAWPVREKTLAFNRAFNAWSDEVRDRFGRMKG